MTAADDDIDEDALLYGDVGACATRATTPTRRARRHTILPLKLSRALDARTARKTRHGATDDDVRISHDPDDDAPVRSTTTATTARAAAAPVKAAAAPPRTSSPNVPDDGRPTAVYVASLTWWTTDAELEAILGEFGRVKSLTFFADKATGKSKGCCAVEFATADAAAQCKENLHGKEINGKSCVVTFAEIPKVQPAAASLGRNDPLPPPPDTAWKGPIPPDKPGYGGVPYPAPVRPPPPMHPQQMMMMQQQMRGAPPGARAQTGAGVGPPPPPPPIKRARQE